MTLKRHLKARRNNVLGGFGKFANYTYIRGVDAYSYNAPNGFNGLIILHGSNHSGLVLSNQNELINVVGCTVNGRNITITGAVVWNVTLIGG